MLSVLTMRGCRGFSSVMFLAALGASLLAASGAMAQTVSYSMQTLPERFLPDGGDLGVSTRQAGQNPEGISFSDCDSDQTLSFFMYTTGFASVPGSSLGVYATVGGTCIDEGALSGSTASCWPLRQPLTSVADGSHTINVRVQDLVAYMETAVPQSGTYTAAKSSVCQAQTSATGEAMTIWFIPLVGGQAVGTAITYPIAVDMLGPPPPTGVSIMDGNSLFVINWAANSDSVTQGYNVYLHALGPADAGAISEDFDADHICTGEGDGGSDDADTDAEGVDGGADADDTGDGGTEASDDAGTPDATSSPADASIDVDASTDATSNAADGTAAGAADGGTPLADATTADTGTSSSSSGGSSGSGSSSGGSSTGSTGGGGGACANLRQPNGNAICLGNTAHDNTLSTTVYTVASTTTSSTGDDAGVTPTSGGISAVSSQYLLNATAGMTVTGESSSTYTATGLDNNTVYAVAVSAVDDFGNVGPPSTPQACDFPAVVDDFWTAYTDDGGHAGGGFCALEAAGAPAGSTVAFGALGAGAIAVLRRRRLRGQS
jgi:MYXO-CTERM domain-containing protein